MSDQRGQFTTGPASGTALIAVAALGTVASATVVANEGVQQGWYALFFVVCIALGEVFRIRMPGGRDTAPIATAICLAYAMLPSIGGVPLTYTIPLVVSVTAVGSLTGAVFRLAGRRPIPLDDLARRLIIVACVAGTFRPFLESEWFGRQTTTVIALFMTVVVLVALVLDSVMAALVRAGTDRAPYSQAVIDEIRAMSAINAATGATAVLTALAAPSMGWIAVPIFTIPLALTQFSFRKYAHISSTYLQTIRALSRVTEVGGYTETGHARRVSRLAVSVGIEMGLSEREVRELEYAALMHDIGQLSLEEPIPGGSTLMTSSAAAREIAGLGSAVIKQTGVLDHVAEVVERQADAYYPGHGHHDDTIPIESRIIRACNDYDDLVGASLESDRMLHAVERLHLGITSEYDPRVVDTLTRIVKRRTGNL
jgi:hypothetical protein